jgi:hypothetical protein
MELVTMNDHLNGTLRDATEYKERFEKGDRSLLHLATAFQRGIYDTQIGKLKSLADPLVIEVVQFYDKLSNLERVKSYVFSASFELTGLQPEQERAVQLAPKYYEALNEAIKRVNDLLPILSGLIAKLERIS